MEMKTLCRRISSNESLNYNQQELQYNDSRKTGYLTVYPFTNCAPYDRVDTIQQWNEIACKIFKYENKVEVKIPNPEAGKVEPEYTVSYYSNNGKFKITAQSNNNFDIFNALTAIKQAMADVIKAINEIIDMAWMHSKMLECFPEFNTTITEKLNTDIKLVSSQLKTLKDDIGQIKPFSDDASLATQFSLIENEVGKLKLTIGKHIEETNRLRTIVNKPKRKRPRK